MRRLRKLWGIVSGRRRRRWRDIQRVRQARAWEATNRQWDAMEQVFERQIEAAPTIEERLEIRKDLWEFRLHRSKVGMCHGVYR